MANDPVILKGRYQLNDTLGKGGMAVVYLARDRMLERDVAIKILKEDYAKDVNFRERFRQEAKAAANLTHPNIVTVHDFGIEADKVFIVMEHVPGKNLNTIIQERGQMDILEGLDLIINACKGIGYAHRSGLVHCDVKPHNFLVTPDNQIKVTDFGIARALASIHPDEESDVVWGSPQYFSPEQASGQKMTPASDVYSMGVVMYQLFTGQPPFIATTSSEMARLHRSATPIPPKEINTFISDELQEVMLKVLSKEPSARYRTADQLGRVLQLIAEKEAEYQASLPPEARTYTTPAQTEAPRASTGPNPINLVNPPSAAAQIDWATVGLSLLTLTSVGGLIPFSIWVYNTFFPPFP